MGKWVNEWMGEGEKVAKFQIPSEKWMGKWVNVEF